MLSVGIKLHQRLSYSPSKVIPLDSTKHPHSAVFIELTVFNLRTSRVYRDGNHPVDFRDSISLTAPDHQRVTFGRGVPELMVVFNHSSQRETLEYLCIQPEEVKSIYLNEL